MEQKIIVYIIIGIAVMGALRFCYRKLKAFKKNKVCEDCRSCPLKNKCKMEKNNSSCCH